MLGTNTTHSNNIRIRCRQTLTPQHHRSHHLISNHPVYVRTFSLKHHPRRLNSPSDGPDIPRPHPHVHNSLTRSQGDLFTQMEILRQFDPRPCTLRSPTGVWRDDSTPVEYPVLTETGPTTTPVHVRQNDDTSWDEVTGSDTVSKNPVCPTFTVLLRTGPLPNVDTSKGR